jgi:tripartite-type tricarboxylate transporter receptor subunit TctC
MIRRNCAAALLAFFALALGQFAFAQDSFPSKPIRIIVPYPPGGTADSLPRLIGERLSAYLGQPVIFENRPGAGANLGAEVVFRAEPDGHTLLVAAPHVLTTNSIIYKLTFDPAQLAPISIIATYPNILVSNPKSPFASLVELIAYARANPGKLNYASQGNSTSSHLTGEMLKIMAGVNIVHVPYKGSGPALTDLIGGQVDLMFDNLFATMQYIKTGRLRILGVGSAKRLSALPDVPAIGEVLPGFVSETWMALAAPPKTPSAITAKISAAVAEAVRSPDVSKRLIDLNLEPVGNTPAQMAEIVRQDTERWVGVVRTANVKAD